MLKYFIAFILCSVSLSAQYPDTLLTTILRIENDTEKVNQLYKHGFDLVDQDPQLSYTYAKHCEKAAQKSGSQKHIAKSINLLAQLFYTHGHYKRAVVYFEDYLKASTALRDTLGMAHGYMNLASAYMLLEDLKKAEKFYLKAINYYNILNDRSQLANALSNLGVLKQKQKQLDAAKENYLKAFEIGKELSSYEIRSICLNNLAQIFSDKGNYEKALAYNYDALELRELMEADVDVSDSYLSIAEIALKQKKTALAEENLDLALQLSKKIGYTQGTINYYKLFSELQSQKNNYQSSVENLKLYMHLNDSILLTEGAEPAFNFTETEEPAFNSAPGQIRNLWLLILLFLFLIIIPFVLIRYKR